MEWIVSDQGSHFKNSLLRGIIEETHVKHHFTTAYSPWANGTVERVCREVLRACRSLCSEWKLAPRDWPSVIETIQSVLNNSPLKRLGISSFSSGSYRTPMEAFTGQRSRRSLLRALPPSVYSTAATLDEAQAIRVIGLESLQAEIQNMHVDIGERISVSRARKVAAHNKKTNIQKVNFVDGDFVLVRSATSPPHKLAFMWQGPRRIVETKSELVFIVEDIVSGKREVVHAARIILYRDDLRGKEVSDELRAAAEHSCANYQMASAIHDIRSGQSGYELQVEWDGLPDSVDFTWEPASTLHEDIPVMVMEFLQTSGKTALKTNLRSQLSSTSQE